MIFSPCGLYCCICGIKFWLNSTPGVYQKSAFGGPVCSKSCYDDAQLKYAKMILGKDTDK